MHHYSLLIEYRVDKPVKGSSFDSESINRRSTMQNT
jgi:hypothetical protein